ncbi:hypothetical protein GCM10009557_32320 [Virgisporangium ochraceum]|uniref:Aspartate carbamoyltransferase n=1 Tax=Virgisporangium ochraceum TaxID=65505 RepID=A0A8J3ZVI8_9ACTN|nr:hypothetical protein [Virgisporangium ochraceum]GIJ70739.1 hypothetical protein Voc01_056560 [Virgisporangium ochraceum]
MTRTRNAVLAAAASLALVAGCGDSPDRQAEVAAKGASVMPFDLERTTHRFARTETGGVQTVVADNPADTGQITLIRQHLRLETDRFSRGDYTDPGRIHGDDMPGLAALRDGAARITVTYRDDPAGGVITYTTTDQALVTALHAWFDAQVSDHGQHAEHG